MLAFAKVNLHLHVTAKRNDGYHCLRSLVMFAQAGDESHVELHDGFVLEMQGEYAKQLMYTDTKNNLITRAAHALAAEAGIACHARVCLSKNLPIGAGLGGGSADAAATLRLLNSLWQLDYPLETLAAIAAKIGSDVTACLYSVPLIMEGVGERIVPCATLFDVPILMVNPKVMVTTPAVFGALQPPYDKEITLPTHFESSDELFNFLYSTHNTLQPAAIRIAPVIDDLLNELSQLPHVKIARMSGSGATCFALFDEVATCQTAASQLKLSHPDYWIVPTMLRGSHHE